MRDWRPPLVSLIGFGLLLGLSGSARAAVTGCERLAPGSVIPEPADLFSHDGKLALELAYRTATGTDGNTEFCYVLPDGSRSPTLHVNPGDRLQIRFTNETPVPGPSARMPTMSMPMPADPNPCGAAAMNASSTNIHFHGTNAPPTCHQDEVIRTLVNSGETFSYDVAIPSDEPPGLYWYHPHVHGMSEAAVLGGASGATIVDGIERAQPRVAHLPQRVLVIRDNLVPGAPTPSATVPSWDLSVNYVPVPYPKYPPAVLPMKPRERQLWRVVNAGADTILDLQLRYDGAPQTLELVALDGVAIGSQDGTKRGRIVKKKNILLPPAGRAEFIVTGPGKKVKSAILSTLHVNTGPFGDSDPERPILTIRPGEDSPPARVEMPEPAGPAVHARFGGLEGATPTSNRKLYFSEVPLDPNDPASPTSFYITVDGQTPTLFDPSAPPAITTTQGAVEDWVVENRAKEDHAFHIHQIHFLLLERNGVRVSRADKQYLDTVDIPYWSGSGPYPSVKVRLDFRGADVGDFVYHCHILEHEDGGMMAVIRVLPR
jgi:FtsP/CotA-like multicopper oxidase with cupredoxin domain